MLRTTREIKNEQDRYGGYSRSAHTKDTYLGADSTFSPSYTATTKTSTVVVEQPKVASFTDPATAPEPIAQAATFNNSATVNSVYTGQSYSEAQSGGVNYSNRNEMQSSAKTTVMDQPLYMNNKIAYRPMTSHQQQTMQQPTYSQATTTAPALEPKDHGFIYVPVDVPRKRKTNYQRKSREEIMPSIQRAQDVERVADRSAAKGEEKETAKDSSRFKMILGVYIAVILVIAAIVIGTGVAISSSTAVVESLNKDLKMQTEIYMAQSAYLDELADLDNVQQRAESAGMTSAENAKELELIAAIPQDEYARRTNWFDQFCDFISKVFGIGG